MTSKQYRHILEGLTDVQRRELSEHIFLGGQPTPDSMVHALEQYPEKVESKAVVWLKHNVPEFQLETEAERVDRATIESAEVGKESLKVSQKSLRVSYWAVAIAVLALLVSIIALWK